MKRASLILLLIASLSVSGVAQKKVWQVTLSPFFDNTEFGGSTVTNDQTMAGARLTPTIGLAFDSVHRIMAGVTLLKEFGSSYAIDSYAPIAYYAFKRKSIGFTMGAFPRNYAVENYPRIFFQDSISYYRPIMNGLSFNVAKNNSYFNVWLDWTSKQSPTQRETFFAGISSRLQQGVFYVQHFDYLMHYAKMNPAPANQFIHDNCLLLTSLGIDLTPKTKLTKLDFNVGWLCGLEDNRGTTDWLMHDGLMIDATIEYKGIGLKNNFYYGEKQQFFYPNEENKLYWGDSFYRLNTYNRTDIYITFFKSDKINSKFVYSLHASENKLFHEQGLYLTVNLNNYLPTTETKPHFLWYNKTK
jgi:hypothetical protein